MNMRWLRTKAKIRNLKYRVGRWLDLKRSKLYRIIYHYSDESTGNTTEMGRVLSKDEGLVLEFVKNVMYKPEYREQVVEYDGFLLLDMPPDCEACEDPVYEDKDECLLNDGCTGCSESFEIQQIPNEPEEREYRLVTGENMYWDLTLLTRTEKRMLEEDPTHWKQVDAKYRAEDWHVMAKAIRLIQALRM